MPTHHDAHDHDDAHDHHDAHDHDDAHENEHGGGERGDETHDHDADEPIISVDDPRLSAAQRQAALTLIADTAIGMIGLDDVAAVEAAGYTSIGDAGTGWEHFVNTRSSWAPVR
jgi:hypothetical protein